MDERQNWEKKGYRKITWTLLKSEINPNLTKYNFGSQTTAKWNI